MIEYATEGAVWVPRLGGWIVECPLMRNYLQPPKGVAMSNGHSVTEWIAAMKAGDEAAVDALVQRYFDKLVGVARGVYAQRFPKIPRTAEDEEDAAQSALKSFWARAADFAEVTNRNDLLNLLAKITIHKVYRQRRRATATKRGGKMHAHSFEDLDNVLKSLSDPEAAAELEDTCRTALALLNADLQRVAQLWLEDKSAAEIAEQLGVTERTVYRRVATIRQIWDEHFGETD